jgi:dihydroorotase
VNGVIQKMGVIWQHVREVREYDLADKIVTPGFFDMHVHFREPGQTHKEDIQSGSLAAAYGGFTGVLCMPNTEPPIDNIEVLNQLKEKASGSKVDIYFTGCATKNREGRSVSDLSSLAENGGLAFTDDGSPIEDDEIMRQVLGASTQFQRPVLQHCEFKNISNSGVIAEGEVSRRLHLKGIPRESEYKIIERDIELLRAVPGARYHVQHISTKQGVELVRKAKAENLNVTCEVCPHHFILTDEDVLKYGTNAKMNPPLRPADDIDAICKGLMDGTIDAICTDHAPHTDEEKSLPLEQAPFGIIGLETAVGLAYTYLVEKEVLTLERLIEKMSIAPRKILNLPPVSIKEGEKANLTILDPNLKWTVDVNKFHSKSKNSPYHNWELKCKPIGVVNYNSFLIND